MFIPDTPTRDQEEILMTLRALAGLVSPRRCAGRWS